MSHLVLDGAVLWEQLGGQVLLRDARVVRRELIPGHAKRAHPHLGHVVHAGVGVEHTHARLAPAQAGITSEMRTGDNTRVFPGDGGG